MSTPLKVLGLDVSTTTIGIGLLEVNGSDISFLSIEHFNPPKKGDLITRLAKTQRYIKKVIKSLKPDYIAIEDIVEYMPNKTTSHSIIALAQVNRIICLTAYDYLKRSPELFNVLSIRHGIKHTKALPSKDQIPAVLEKHLNITLPPLLITKGKNKGNFAPEYYDRADGVAVALYYSFILTGKIKPKTPLLHP